MADIRLGNSGICPRCGNGGLRIMDIDETVPLPDAYGYPQFYCRTCGRLFTVLTHPDELTREKEEGKRRLEFNDLFPPSNA